MECASKSEYLLTNYMDIFSLAQADADAHQECKREKRLVLAFSREGLWHLRKTRSVYSSVFAGRI